MPSLSDSPYALQRLAAITESVGDLSTTQRCVQYGNAIKLLVRTMTLTSGEKDRLSRQFMPDLSEQQKVENLLGSTDAAVTRVRGKQSVSGCQEEHRASGSAFDLSGPPKQGCPVLSGFCKGRA